LFDQGVRAISLFACLKEESDVSITMRKFTLTLDVSDKYDRFDSAELRSEVMLFLDGLSLNVERASVQWTEDASEDKTDE
jgi:hypothetical protein